MLNHGRNVTQLLYTCIGGDRSATAHCRQFEDEKSERKHLCSDICKHWDEMSSTVQVITPIVLAEDLKGLHLGSVYTKMLSTKNEDFPLRLDLPSTLK